MVEPQPSKLVMRVRFSSPAPRPHPGRRRVVTGGSAIWTDFRPTVGLPGLVVRAHSERARSRRTGPAFDPISGVSSVPSTVDQLSPTRVKLTVEVPFDDLKPSLDKAYREIAKSVNIPGFRKGKVPPMVIDQRFGRGVIIQEALNDALPKFYGEAVAENNLNPLAQPEVEVTKLEDGDSIEFTAEVDVRPEFDLPDFSTLTATVDAIEVTDEQIDDQIDGLRQRFGSKTVVERPAADGDRGHHRPGRHQGRRAAARRDRRRPGVRDRLRRDARRPGRGRHRAVRRRVGRLRLDAGRRSAEGRGRPTSRSPSPRCRSRSCPSSTTSSPRRPRSSTPSTSCAPTSPRGWRTPARLEQAAKARDAVLENLLAQLDIDAAGEPDRHRDRRAQDPDPVPARLGQPDLDQYLAETGEAEDAEELLGRAWRSAPPTP